MANLESFGSRAHVEDLAARRTTRAPDSDFGCVRRSNGEDPPPPPTDSGRADREIYDNNCEGDDELPGDLLREDGDDPTGDPDADAPYTDLGLVYDYFRDTFDRDSYDDDGAQIILSINYCAEPGVPEPNAYWDGDQIKLGEGWNDALDITTHELTHAINDETANLDYSCQSGALDESIADIFASNVDPDDWEIGEDVPNGPLRDMADPESFGYPAHVDNFVEQENDGTEDTDYGGVHENSSIPNHAYYLMVQDIGRDAAEQIVYRAFTQKLESDSGFEDFRSASLEAAAELGYAENSPEYRGVERSFAEVGLDGTWEAPEVEGC
jgi:Zn-dependent metalloprotease